MSSNRVYAVRRHSRHPKAGEQVSTQLVQPEGEEIEEIIPLRKGEKAFYI